MRRNSGSTLADVAREAGVSTMAVSVVLNGARSSAQVSEETRARIIIAANRLHYRRNALAHGLSRNRINTIGLIAVVDREDMNLYFLELLHSILSAASERGQSVKVVALTNWQQDQAQVLEACDGRIDGMILIGAQLDPEVCARLASSTCFVTVHAAKALPRSYNLDVDNTNATCAITRHLIRLGHRHIVHFTGALGVSGAPERTTGFLRAMQEVDTDFDPNCVWDGHFSIASGSRSTRRLLTEDPSRPLPTAIVCGSDAIAFGCIDVLNEYGIRVPDQISVVGFDDVVLARMTRPPLTTMRQPFRLLGKRAVELLLAQLDGDLTVGPDPQTECLPTELVIRESCGPPPQTPVIPAQLQS